nr:Uma2 family endonuclease [Caldilineaceae bacterium]
VVVACGEPQFEDDQIDTLLTPTVLIEVLSKSTMAFDRGEKFEHYRAIASLTDYIMVAQDKLLVEHFVRQADDFWLFSEAR